MDGSMVSPVGNILNVFIVSLNNATNELTVTQAFTELTNAVAGEPQLPTAIIAMPEAFSKRLVDPKKQAALKEMLGDSGNVGKLLEVDAVTRFNALVSEAATSTPAVAGAPAPVTDSAEVPVAAVGGSINLQGGAKKKSTKSTKKSTTKNSTTKKSSKKPSKKLVGGAKKKSKTMTKKVSKKPSKKPSKKMNGGKKSSKKPSKKPSKKSSKKSSKK